MWKSLFFNKSPVAFQTIHQEQMIAIHHLTNPFIYLHETSFLLENNLAAVCDHLEKHKKFYQTHITQTMSEVQ